MQIESNPESDSVRFSCTQLKFQLAVTINCLEKAAWMNDSRNAAQPSPDFGGQGKRGPVSGHSTQIHGGLLETLLAAAGSEDELVTELLLASLRDERPRMVKLARAIAEHRGVFQENEPPVAAGCHAQRQVRYKDKLLAAIHREEILLDALAAASARGVPPKLFSLCRELCDNRKRFDPEFHRKTNPNKGPDL
jgi:hypothetical protein